MLDQTPPPHITARLADMAVPVQDLRLCTSTDIDALGQYETQWLCVTDARLLVLSDDQPAQVLADLNLAQASEVRCQPVVGSGLLQARVDGVFVDLLRYSNRLADQFEKAARKIDRSLHGEPIVVHPEDNTDTRRCPKCGVMLDYAGQACPRCINQGAVMVRMIALMKPYLGAAIGMMCLLIVGIGLDLVTPQLTRYLVDNVLPGSAQAAQQMQAESGLRARQMQLLLYVVLVLAGVQVARMFVNIFNGRLGNRVGTAITADMRVRLVHHLQQLSVAYYDRQQVGSLVSRVAYDTEAIQGFINQLTSGFLFQIIMLVGVGAMMFTIDPMIALYALVPAPLVIAGSIVFWRYIYPRYYKFWDASSKQAGMLSGILSGIRVVKAFGQEGREGNRFNAASERLKQTRRSVDGAVVVFNPMMAVVFQLGGWIVWYMGGRDVIGGTLTLGELMAFFGYLAMFYGPLSTLTQFTNWLTQFTTQAHRIFEILDTPAQIAQAKQPTRIDDLRGHIQFENVTFGYHRHTPVVRAVHLEIQPGQMIGVVGRSGSGKTTLINLICRFYDVQDGSVKIDGVDVRDLSMSDLRRQLGVVLQEPFLFRGSIWDNIVYGLPDATPEQVIQAAKAANGHDFIMRTSHGYDTWVGERGAGLSGGERQRVSIARVLLMDPRILILDEATSAVDAESEAAIQAALAELVKNRTTIAIAHRLSTLRESDEIVVMDAGRVVETGPHDELVTRPDGLYARLAKLQGQDQAHTMTADHAVVDEQREDLDDGAPAASHRPRWLTPDNANIHLGGRGALHVTVVNDRIYPGVFALRCLPVHHPAEFISMRYVNVEKRETEVGLIRQIDDWPDNVQKLIRESLLKRYFVLSITSILRIKTVQGYLEFDVITDAGPISFVMRSQSDRAQDYGKRGKLLLDTDENRYLIPDIDDLPEPERLLFQRHIYW